MGVATHVHGVCALCTRESLQRFDPMAVENYMSDKVREQVK